MMCCLSVEPLGTEEKSGKWFSAAAELAQKLLYASPTLNNFTSVNLYLSIVILYKGRLLFKSKILIEIIYF